MPHKTDKLNIRIAPAIKQALRTVSAQEHRSISNMVEFLVLAHCKKSGVKVVQSEPRVNHRDGGSGKPGKG